MNPEEEKGSGDADLCSTPAVDADYLVSLSTRLANFAAQKKSKMETTMLMQEGAKKHLVRKSSLITRFQVSTHI